MHQLYFLTRNLQGYQNVFYAEAADCFLNILPFLAETETETQTYGVFAKTTVKGQTRHSAGRDEMEATVKRNTGHGDETN